MKIIIPEMHVVPEMHVFWNDMAAITPFPQVPHPHNPQLAKTPLPKLKKRGTPFFADRPPHSSYRPRWVKSKEADGIPRQLIALRFVGYPTFAGRLHG
jgi:hypothetical protein